MGWKYDKITIGVDTTSYAQTLQNNNDFECNWYEYEVEHCDELAEVHDCGYEFIDWVEAIWVFLYLVWDWCFSC